MQAYPVNNENFKYNKIVLISGGFWKGPKFKYDDQDIKWKKNKALVKNDLGNDIEITKTGNPFDPSPWIMINGIKHHPMGKLTATEQVFIYLPLGLIGVGGAIGGALGAFAFMVNGSLVRGYKDNPFLKYGLTLITSFMAAVIWYLTALMIRGHI
jgi:hypothetical protein